MKDRRTLACECSPGGGVAGSQRCLGGLTVGIKFAVAFFDEEENQLETRGMFSPWASEKGGVVGIDVHEVFELGAWGLGRGGKYGPGVMGFASPAGAPSKSHCPRAVSSFAAAVPTASSMPAMREECGCFFLTAAGSAPSKVVKASRAG